MRPHSTIAQPLTDGVILVDKPQTWTSHDVCAFIRKRFKIKKVGHAGTLDPLATGLLVILLGKATKQSLRFSASDKEYQGVMELGIETDSHDRNGKVLREVPWEHVTLEDLKLEALDFTGDIVQIPPMVSALKHQGVRLYKLARKGKTVPREGRNVTVFEFDLKSKEGKFVRFSARVSKGTYLRTLIHDLGQAVGCSAALCELRRMRSGAFDVKNCVTIDELREFSLDDLRAKMFPLWALPVSPDK